MSGPARIIGRYALFDRIASGGMGMVHLGRARGAAGFTRTVVIKRLHPQYAEEPDFVSMFLDEARVAARIRHPNVVPTIDVVSEAGELFLVMEYVQGESLAHLVKAARKAGERIPPAIAASIITGVLFGLHAAHEATNEHGVSLDIVHRDVSPQNILVGVDGVARVLDFGVAKAVGRLQTTREGQLKGKIAYMPPEQIHGRVTRQTDVYAAAVVLWEALTGTRLFQGDNEGELLNNILTRAVPPPSRIASDVPTMFDAIVLRGLERDPEARYSTAREMARALETSGLAVPPSVVGEWVEKNAATELSRRAALVATVERAAIEDARPATQSDFARLRRSELETMAKPPTTGTEAHAVQTTSSVVSTPAGLHGRVGPRRIVWVTLLLGSIAAAVLVVRSRAERPSDPAPQLNAARSIPEPTTPAASVTEATTTPSSSVSAAAPSATSSSKVVTPRPNSKKPAILPTPSAPVTAKPNCDSPFEIVNGKERLKPECRKQ